MLPKYRDVAMVFQSYALYPHMTVAENIGYPLKLRGVAQAEQATPDPRGRRQGPSRGLSRPLSRASSPAASASAWRSPAPSSAGPSVFLMDEPLSNLDAKLREPHARRWTGVAPSKVKAAKVDHNIHLTFSLLHHGTSLVVAV